MSTRAILIAAFAAAAITVTADPATAAPAPQHCVNHVIGERADGELVLSANRCYTTFDGAMRAEGVSAWGEGAASRASSAGPAALLFTLAVHYDYASFNPAGGTTSTVGSVCGGGYSNMTPAWNNRISSTSNGCPNVTHYDLFNLGGGWFTTTGAGGNVGALSDRVGSVRYA